MYNFVFTHVHAIAKNTDNGIPPRLGQGLCEFAFLVILCMYNFVFTHVHAIAKNTDNGIPPRLGQAYVSLLSL